jgi:hypothetical protein
VTDARIDDVYADQVAAREFLDQTDRCACDAIIELARAFVGC